MEEVSAAFLRLVEWLWLGWPGFENVSQNQSVQWLELLGFELGYHLLSISESFDHDPWPR